MDGLWFEDMVASSAVPEAMTESPSGASTRGSHQLSAVMTCELLWFYYYMAKVRPRGQRDNMVLGTLVHLFLAYHYAVRLPGGARPTWFAARPDLEAALIEDSEGRLDLVKEARDMYAAYCLNYAADPWTPVAVEEEFRATVGELDPGGPDPTLDDEVVSCRTDLVVEMNGLTWIVDHKTAAPDRRSGRLYAWNGCADWKLNLQVLQNLLILRKRMPERFVHSFSINRIKKERPFNGFERNTVDVPAMAYQIAPKLIREAVRRERDLRRRIEAGGDPVSNFGSCYGRFGPCSFFDLCTAHSEDQQNQLFSKLYVIQD